jgi:microsomal epoxide hydrolase
MIPFRISVSDDLLSDLRRRLRQTRWPAVIERAGWNYGADISYLRSICDYWQNGFSWRRREAELNLIPQYLSRVDGLDLHFLYVKGQGSRSIPLLLLHGWPGSVVEFLEVIGPLTNPAAYGITSEFCFDVVIPSLPGFGFSGQPTESGWGVTRIAAALNHLMVAVLDYSTYCVQGGDWGTMIGTCIARNFPQNVRALHINMPHALPPPGVDPGPEWRRKLDDLTGYLHLQNTRPDTLTMGLSDTPAGLAAWILEKFRSWSDCNGDLTRVISRDTLLTNLMFYWATNSIASATRIYFETAQEGIRLFAPPQLKTPTAIAVFPKEPFQAPRAWLKPLYNIVRWTLMPRGGHFAALEEPELLAVDLHEFFADYAAAPNGRDRRARPQGKSRRN